jgi:hypothetical protein
MGLPLATGKGRVSHFKKWNQTNWIEDTGQYFGVSDVTSADV